jgi:hypothetical protein
LSSQAWFSATAFFSEAIAASRRTRSAPLSSPACGAIMSSTMLVMPAFCLATVSAWIFGTRARSRFSRICGEQRGIFSMRAVAALRRCGIGAKSRAISVYSAPPAMPL